MSEAVKTAKPRTGEALRKFYKDTRAELKKVIWPDRTQVTNSTGVVIGSIFIIGAFIWIFDALIGFIVQKILGQ